MYKFCFHVLYVLVATCSCVYGESYIFVTKPAICVVLFFKLYWSFFTVCILSTQKVDSHICRTFTLYAVQSFEHIASEHVGVVLYMCRILKLLQNDRNHQAEVWYACLYHIGEPTVLSSSRCTTAKNILLRDFVIQQDAGYKGNYHLV